MLDHLKDADRLEDACELLPVETEAYMPDVYDTCYGFDVLAGMLKIIHNRNNADTIASTSKPASAFRKLLDMIPDTDKKLAVADFKERFWNWADLYFQGLDKLLTENYKNDQALSRLLKQTKAYDEEHFKPKKSAPLMMMAKAQVPSVATQGRYSLDSDKRHSAQILLRHNRPLPPVQQEGAVLQVRQRDQVCRARWLRKKKIRRAEYENSSCNGRQFRHRTQYGCGTEKCWICGL